MKKFRVRRVVDSTHRWTVANGDKYASTLRYIDKKGEEVVLVPSFPSRVKAEEALAKYEAKQKPAEKSEDRTPGIMTLERFDTLVEYIVTERIKKVMCAKSAEYAQGENKLHNFDHAGRMRNISPMEALRGMKLKHEVSIEDMLNGLKEGKTYPRALWEEKFTDNINYQILQWAILARDNDWR